MNEFFLHGRPWLRPLICLALLLIGAPVQAQAPAPVNAATIQASPLALGSQMQLLEDPSRTLAWDEVVEDSALPWRASTMAVLNFSFSRSVWWVKLALENPTAEPMTRVLELAMPLQDDVQVRWQVAGRTPRFWHTGDRQPFAQRPVPYRYPVFRLDLPAHGQGVLWLRLDTHDGLFEAIPLKLWQPDAFVNHGLRVFGLLPSTPLVEYALNIGSILEMLLLALILSWRIHDLKRQALHAQQEQFAAQRDMTARLEAEVLQRTAELQQANDRLHELPTTDGLTGLLNRRSFDEALQLASKHAQREGEPLALAILDVDHFKRINDSLGHQAGDAVLAQVAALLREGLRRDTDRVFRLGGEEFAVLMSGQAALQARARVEQIRQRVEAELSAALARRMAADGAAAAPSSRAGTISAGVCLWLPLAGDSALSPRELYHQADQAMYDAKGQGRNRVVLRQAGRG